MKSWILALRPKTLTAALVPIVVASSLAASLGYQFFWTLPLWALLASLFIQFGTNLVNDAMDFKRGTDTAERLGPKRVTQSGLLTSRAVLFVAFVCFALALLCGVPLIVAGGWPILIIGLASILFAYLYTGGPLPLAYIGLGEIFVILFFGIIAVGGLFYIESGLYSESAFVAGLQVGLLAAVLIAVNNLRDVEGDRKTAKRTLAVILGIRAARTFLSFFIFAPFILGFYWLWIVAKPWAFGLPLLTLPLALMLSRGLWRSAPSRHYNSFLARAAALHLLFGILLATGLLLTRAPT